MNTQATIITRRALLLSALFAFLMVLICGGMSVYILADPDLEQAMRLSRVAFQVDRFYQNNLDWDRVLESGMRGMIAQLDRFSTYHEPRQFTRLNEELSGSYSGIGVSVVDHDDGLLVMSVREQGPAAEAGLLNGDIILAADNTPLTGLGAEESTYLLRGPEGTSVDCRVYRPATEDTLEFEVTRREIDFAHIPFAGFTPDSLIYIRLLDFDAGASDDLEAALDSLLDKPGVAPKGVILDLRGNPGGLFQEAYLAADLFLEDGQFIVGTEGRSRWQQERHYSTGDDMTGGLPMAVLVDNGSASSAEIMAGALKQLNRAVLVGDTTFGKGLVQGFTQFGDGSALRLTISRYYLEGGVYLNEFDSTLNQIGQGLPPTHPFEFVELAYFPLTLERSLLLNQFANLYQAEILAATEGFGLDDSWLQHFKQYADSMGFKYRSPTSQAVQVLDETALIEGSGPAAKRVIARLKALVEVDDGQQIERYGRYIKMRLKQIAIERGLGTYAAYARAIVPDRPDILFAARILKGEQP